MGGLPKICAQQVLEHLIGVPRKFSKKNSRDSEELRLF
jgi:hypothetical protein